MSDRTREAMKSGVATGIGMAIYDLLNGKLGVDTAYRAAFVSVFCAVVYWVFPIKR